MANQSIHPRVDNGRTRFDKVNTSRSKRRKTVERAIAGIGRHLEQHPRDAVSERHLAALNRQLSGIAL